MKKILLILLFSNFVFVGASAAQDDIKDVDFNNFTYQPACGSAEPQTMTVAGGVFFEEKDVTPPAPENPPAPAENGVQPGEPKRIIERRYFKPYETIYGDLTGDAIEEAVVLTTCSRGGVESYSEAFIFGMRDGGAALLARIEGGDRALGGLRSVRIDGGALVVERSRPGFTGEACCAEFAETTKYNLAGGALNQVGETVSVELYPPTRIEVNEQQNQTSFALVIKPVDKIKRFIISGRKGRTLTVSTDSPDADVRLYKGAATVLTPKPVRKNEDMPATNVLSIKLKETGDYVFEIGNTTKQDLSFSVNVEIK